MPERIYQSSARNAHDFIAYKVVLLVLAAIGFASPALLEFALRKPVFTPEQMLTDKALLDPVFMTHHFPHIQVDGCGLEYSSKRGDYVYSGTDIIAKLMPTTSYKDNSALAGGGKDVLIVDWTLGTTTKIDSGTNRTLYYDPHKAKWLDATPPADHTISP